MGKFIYYVTWIWLHLSAALLVFAAFVGFVATAMLQAIYSVRPT